MQTLERLEGLIEAHPFLAGLSRQSFGFLQQVATLRRFASQQEIFQEGSEADHFYLIVRGNVALDMSRASGGYTTIQTLGAGEPLGWSWLFPPGKWHFTARTTLPTEVLSFDAFALRRQVEHDDQFRDEFLFRLAKTLIKRLEATQLQLAFLASPSKETSNPRSTPGSPRPSEANRTF